LEESGLERCESRRFFADAYGAEIRTAYRETMTGEPLPAVNELTAELATAATLYTGVLAALPKIKLGNWCRFRGRCRSKGAATGCAFEPRCASRKPECAAAMPSLRDGGQQHSARCVWYNPRRAARFVAVQVFRFRLLRCLATNLANNQKGLPDSGGPFG